MNIRNDWKKLTTLGPFGKMDFSTWVWDENIKVGLDIGAYSIKFVQMKRTSAGHALQKIGYKEIAPAADSPPAVSPDQIIAEALSELCKQLDIKTRIVNLVISDPAIYLRHICIPSMAEEELTKAIKWLAEKYVPFPVDNALVDFQILRENVKRDDNQMDIMIVAAERKTIEKYLSILKMARVIPARIDVSPFAVVKALRTCHSLPSEEMVAIIDMGAQNTSVSITQGDNLQLVRNFSLGGEQLTAALAKELNISFQEAEKIKRTFSLFPTGQSDIENHARILDSFKPALTELVNQINRSFVYCERELVIEKIQKIYLCGGSAVLSGLDQYLTQALGVRIERIDVYKHFDGCQGKYDNLISEGVAEQFMAALGVLV